MAYLMRWPRPLSKGIWAPGHCALPRPWLPIKIGQGSTREVPWVPQTYSDQPCCLTADLPPKDQGQESRQDDDSFSYLLVSWHKEPEVITQWRSLKCSGVWLSPLEKVCPLGARTSRPTEAWVAGMESNRSDGNQDHSSFYFLVPGPPGT